MVERNSQPRAIHDRNSRFTRKLEIEVTAYYDWQTRSPLMNVRNNFSQLTGSKTVAPAAFQVEVVYEQPLFWPSDVTYERYPTSQSSL
jgi:hypothetical protein